MKFKTEINSSQLKKFCRIPKVILEDKNIPFNLKKILLFLYGIQIHSVIPLNNIIRGWLNKKNIKKNILIPSQLRKHLIWLERNEYLTINRKNNKILSVKLNVNRPDIKNSKYFYVKKIFFSYISLSLDHIAIGATYQYFNYMKNIYACHASKILGVDEKTYRKYARQLHEEGFLSTKTVNLLNGERKFTQSIYFLKSSFIMKRRTNLTYGESIHRSLDDISCIEYIFTSKYIYNSSTKEILYMEKKKNSCNLEYYLMMKQEKFEELCRQIQYKLKIAGTTMTLELVQKKTKEYLIKNTRTGGPTFFEQKDFVTYMVEILRPKVRVLSCLMDYINDDEFLEDVLAEVKLETEKDFGKSYLKWKIKNDKNHHLYKSYYTAKEGAIRLLRFDTKNPYSTLNWDEDYDVNLINSIEREVIQRAQKSEERRSKALHIPKINRITTHLPSDFFNIKIPI